MTERERLIELIANADSYCQEPLADYLIANKCHSFSCDIGDTVYTNMCMQGWYFREKDKPYEAKIVFIGLNGVDNFMNVDFGNGHMLQFPFSQIGKTVFLTREEALKERGNK